MQTLSDLSRVKPTAEELLQVLALLETESDRGCALIAGCLLEETLAMALSCHFADCGPAFQNKLYVGGDSPLSTFSSKIRIGRALAIYDDKVEERFGIVKDVRNAFAHALRPLDFSNPTIVAAVRGLGDWEWPEHDKERKLSPARIRYSAFCWAMGKKLFDVATERGGRELEIGFSI